MIEFLQNRIVIVHLSNLFREHVNVFGTFRTARQQNAIYIIQYIFGDSPNVVRESWSSCKYPKGLNKRNKLNLKCSAFHFILLRSLLLAKTGIHKITRYCCRNRHCSQDEQCWALKPLENTRSGFLNDVLLHDGENGLREGWRYERSVSMIRTSLALWIVVFRCLFGQDER